MELNLNGKRVLVTGASRGIGYAIAKLFLEEGANVLINSRNSKHLSLIEQELSETYNETRFKTEICDCTDGEAVEKLGKNIILNWSGIDIVVANVGDGRSIGDAIPNSSHWQRVWDVNFSSALYTARTFLPLLEQSSGVLLFISSIAGLESIGAPVDYSTAKSAVIAFAKNLSRKIAGKVRVNIIAPGNIFFPGGSWDDKMKNDPERTESTIKTMVPMQRFGTPDEIADAAVFLCSNRASFINGAILVVDGGQTTEIF